MEEVGSSADVVAAAAAGWVVVVVVGGVIDNAEGTMGGGVAVVRTLRVKENLLSQRPCWVCWLPRGQQEGWY